MEGFGRRTSPRKDGMTDAGAFGTAQEREKIYRGGDFRCPPRGADRRGASGPVGKEQKARGAFLRPGSGEGCAACGLPRRGRGRSENGRSGGSRDGRPRRQRRVGGGRLHRRHADFSGGGGFGTGMLLGSGSQAPLRGGDGRGRGAADAGHPRAPLRPVPPGRRAQGRGERALQRFEAGSVEGA